MSKNGCNQAFPVPPETWVGDRGYAYPQEGITRRELFAAMAMQGFVANCAKGLNEEGTAKRAVAIADALLDELERSVDKNA